MAQLALVSPPVCKARTMSGWIVSRVKPSRWTGKATSGKQDPPEEIGRLTAKEQIRLEPEAVVTRSENNAFLAVTEAEPIIYLVKLVLIDQLP